MLSHRTIRMALWASRLLLVAVAVAGLVGLGFAAWSALSPALVLWTSSTAWWASFRGWRAMARPLATAGLASLLVGVAAALACLLPAAWLLARGWWSRYRAWLLAHERPSEGR